MKKILSLVLVLLTLTACQSKTAQPRLYGVSFTADVTYFNENYRGECHFSKDKVLTFKITEPEIISGYTVTVSESGITAEYLGLTFTPTEGNMPFSSAVALFYEKICAAADTEAVKEEGGEFKISGGKDADAYTLYISETGLPQKILIPDERFTVYFYNATAQQK